MDFFKNTFRQKVYAYIISFKVCLNSILVKETYFLLILVE